MVLRDLSLTFATPDPHMLKLPISNLRASKLRTSSGLERSQGLGCFSKYSATIASLIEPCKLTFTLTAIVNGHKQYRINELLP